MSDGRQPALQHREEGDSTAMVVRTSGGVTYEVLATIDDQYVHDGFMAIEVFRDRGEIIGQRIVPTLGGDWMIQREKT